MSIAVGAEKTNTALLSCSGGFKMTSGSATKMRNRQSAGRKQGTNKTFDQLGETRGGRFGGLMRWSEAGSVAWALAGANVPDQTLR